MNINRPKKLCAFDAKLIERAATLQYIYDNPGVLAKVLWMLKSGISYDAIVAYLKEHEEKLQ